MKIPQSLKIIALITCTVFTFTTIANAAPMVGGENPIVVDGTSDLAPKALSQVLARPGKVVQGSEYASPAGRQGVQSEDSELSTQNPELNTRPDDIHHDSYFGELREDDGSAERFQVLHALSAARRCAAYLAHIDPIQDMKSIDAMIVFGSADMQVPVEVAKYYKEHKRQVKRIIVVGGGKGNVTEAVAYKNVLVEMGVPAKKIIVPEEDLSVKTGSKNFKENFQYMFNELARRGINVRKLKSIVAVQNPLVVRRAAILTKYYLPEARSISRFTYMPNISKSNMKEVAWQMLKLEQVMFDQHRDLVADFEARRFTSYSTPFEFISRYIIDVDSTGYEWAVDALQARLEEQSSVDSSQSLEKDSNLPRRQAGDHRPSTIDAFKDLAPYGLAPTVSGICAMLVSGVVRVALDDADKDVLATRKASALLLKDGTRLISSDMDKTDITRARAVVHEEVEALMQIVASENSILYNNVFRAVMHEAQAQGFVPAGNEDDVKALRDKKPHLYVNHIIALAFESLAARELGLDLAEKEEAVLSVVSDATAETYANVLFDERFMNAELRLAAIETARENGFEFYVAASDWTDFPNPYGMEPSTAKDSDDDNSSDMESPEYVSDDGRDAFIALTIFPFALASIVLPQVDADDVGTYVKLAIWVGSMLLTPVIYGVVWVVKWVLEFARNLKYVIVSKVTNRGSKNLYGMAWPAVILALPFLGLPADVSAVLLYVSITAFAAFAVWGGITLVNRHEAKRKARSQFAVKDSRATRKRIVAFWTSWITDWPLLARGDVKAYVQNYFDFEVPFLKGRGLAYNQYRLRDDSQKTRERIDYVCEMTRAIQWVSGLFSAAVFVVLLAVVVPSSWGALAAVSLALASLVPAYYVSLAIVPLFLNLLFALLINPFLRFIQIFSPYGPFTYEYLGSSKAFDSRYKTPGWGFLKKRGEQQGKDDSPASPAGGRFTIHGSSMRTLFFVGVGIVAFAAMLTISSCEDPYEEIVVQEDDELVDVDTVGVDAVEWESVDLPEGDIGENILDRIEIVSADDSLAYRRLENNALQIKVFDHPYISYQAIVAEVDGSLPVDPLKGSLKIQMYSPDSMKLKVKCDGTSGKTLEVVGSSEWQMLEIPLLAHKIHVDGQRVLETIELSFSLNSEILINQMWFDYPDYEFPLQASSENLLADAVIEAPNVREFGDGLVGLYGDIVNGATEEWDVVVSLPRAVPVSALYESVNFHLFSYLPYYPTASYGAVSLYKGEDEVLSSKRGDDTFGVFVDETMWGAEIDKVVISGLKSPLVLFDAFVGSHSYPEGLPPVSDAENLFSNWKPDHDVFLQDNVIRLRDGYGEYFSVRGEIDPPKSLMRGDVTGLEILLNTKAICYPEFLVKSGGVDGEVLQRWILQETNTDGDWKWYQMHALVHPEDLLDRPIDYIELNHRTGWVHVTGETNMYIGGIRPTYMATPEFSEKIEENELLSKCAYEILDPVECVKDESGLLRVVASVGEVGVVNFTLPESVEIGDGYGMFCLRTVSPDLPRKDTVTIELRDGESVVATFDRKLGGSGWNAAKDWWYIYKSNLPDGLTFDNFTISGINKAFFLGDVWLEDKDEKRKSLFSAQEGTTGSDNQDSSSGSFNVVVWPAALLAAPLFLGATSLVSAIVLGGLGLVGVAGVIMCILRSCARAHQREGFSREESVGVSPFANSWRVNHSLLSFVAVAALLIISSVASAQTSSDHEKYLRGKLYYRAGSYSSAVGMLNSMTQKTDSAHLYLARSQLALGDAISATDNYIYALRKNKELEEPYVKMGEIHFSEGNFQYAYNDYRAYLHLKPESIRDVDIHMMCAAFNANDKVSQLDGFLRDRLVSNPTEAEVYLGLGYVVFNQGERAGFAEGELSIACSFFERAYELGQYSLSDVNLEYLYIGLAMANSEGDPQVPFDWLQKAIAVTGTNVDAYLKLGQLCNNYGDYVSAYRYLEKALALNKRYDVYVAMVELFINAGEFAEAIKTADIMEERFPSATGRYKARIYCLRATAYYSQGEYDKAIQDAQRAARIDSQLLEAYDVLAMSSFLSKNYALAINAYGAMLVLDSENIKARWHLFMLYAMTGDDERAHKIYNEFGASVENHREMQSLYSTYMSQVDFEAFMMQWWQGYIYMSRGEYQKAVTTFRSLLGMDPKSASACWLLAECYDHLNNPAKSIEYAERALSYDPGIEELYTLLAVAYHVEGRHSDIVSLTKRAAKNCENLRVWSWYAQGFAQLQLGDKSAAEAAFVSATRLAPRDPQLHYEIAASLFDFGMYDLALRYVSRALVIEPTFQAASELRNTIVKKKGRSGKLHVIAWPAVLVALPMLGIVSPAVFDVILNVLFWVAVVSMPVLLWLRMQQNNKHFDNDRNVKVVAWPVALLVVPLLGASSLEFLNGIMNVWFWAVYVGVVAFLVWKIIVRERKARGVQSENSELSTPALPAGRQNSVLEDQESVARNYVEAHTFLEIQEMLQYALETGVEDTIKPLERALEMKMGEPGQVTDEEVTIDNRLSTIDQEREKIARNYVDAHTFLEIQEMLQYALETGVEDTIKPLERALEMKLEDQGQGASDKGQGVKVDLDAGFLPSRQAGVTRDPKDADTSLLEIRNGNRIEAVYPVADLNAAEQTFEVWMYELGEQYQDIDFVPFHLNVTLKRMGVYLRGSAYLSPHATAHRLIFEGAVFHEQVHHAIKSMKLSAGDEDVIAGTIEMRHIMRMSYAIDESAGLPLGTTLEETVSFLQNEDAIVFQPLKRLLNQFTVDGRSLIGRQISVMKRFSEMRHGGQSITVDNETFRARIVALELQFFGVDVETHLREYNTRILNAAVGELHVDEHRNRNHPRVVILDGADELDQNVVEHVLKNEQHALYVVNRDEGVNALMKVQIDDGVVSLSNTEAYEVKDLNEAVNIFRADEKEVSVVSDSHREMVRIEDDAAMLFSTKRVKKSAFKELPFEMVILPFAFNFDRAALEAQAGVNKLFVKSGKLFQVNLDYIVNFGDSMGEAFKHVMKVLTDAMNIAVAARSVKIAA